MLGCLGGPQNTNTRIFLRGRQEEQRGKTPWEVRVKEKRQYDVSQGKSL